MGEVISRRKACSMLMGMAATALHGQTESATSSRTLPGGHPGCHPPRRDVSSYHIVDTLGTPQSDSLFHTEVRNQQAFWNTAHPNGVPTTVYVFNEGGPRNANAYASPKGWILFGYHFYNDHLRRHGRMGIDGILAHEFGHRVQYTYGWSTTNPVFELEADAFSAYYMALRKGHVWKQIRSYADHVVSLGDTNFNSPEHHGTPRQRLAAAELGVNVAAKGARTPRRGYTGQELHQIFTQAIQQQILPYR
jgi:hypothetical protein